MVYNTSQLNFGDLVFYAYGGRVPTGHVGIYIGGGQIIDSIPNGGVSIRDVNYMSFVGGGPIF
jgi:cell wall-associated NlpC family hydrolase